MSVWVDGDLVAAAPAGDGPFETMGRFGERLPLWRLHLERLHRSAAAMGLPCAIDPGLRRIAERLLDDAGDDVLRLQLLAAGDRLHAVMTTRRRPVLDRPLRLLVGSEPGPQSPPLPPPDVKCTPRDFYDRALTEARAAGADDAVIAAADGEVLETAVANLFLLRQGVWRTPPADGRFLPGIARDLLITAAAPPIETTPCTLPDLRTAEAIAVTNAVHGPRPATVDGHGDPAPVAELATAWGHILQELA